LDEIIDLIDGGLVFIYCKRDTTDTVAGRQADRQTDRLTDTERETDRHSETD